MYIYTYIYIHTYVHITEQFLQSDDPGCKSYATTRASASKLSNIPMG